MTAKTPIPDVAGDDLAVCELIDFLALSEEERVAFYGALFAVAADGTLRRDALEFILETIDMAGLADHARHTIWNYLIEPPSLSDCLDVLSTCCAEIRCAFMIHLIEIALVDGVLEGREEEALLQARRALHLTQKQLQAIERFICDAGRRRPRPGDDQPRRIPLQHGVWVLTALGIPAAAVCVTGLAGGLHTPALASAPAAFGVMLAVGTAAGIGTAYAACRLLGRRQSRALRHHERRRRAQLAIRHLQEAIGYLSAKAALAPTDPAVLDQETSAILAERLGVLQQLLAQRQSPASLRS
jgi:hypothetical protein